MNQRSGSKGIFLFAKQKRKGLLVLSFAILALGGCDKLGLSSKPKLETDQQKYSYALGQIIGNDMHSKGIELDQSIFQKSFKAALAGEQNLMTNEQMQQSMMKLREIAMNKMRAGMSPEDKKHQDEVASKAKEDANKNLAAAKAFLEENKKKEGVKTTSSGLQYQIHKEGKGAFPKSTSQVKVTYRGTLTSGQEFDSSKGKDVEFGLNQVIPGWTEGLQLIKPGGKMTLWVPPDLGYGEREVPGIPSNSTLVFDVELKKR